ncbi:AcrR family transcriptional regulator [Cohnella thailandensis]|nr:AcrR family transcriptional regulator [Cohnella thailandensis]
MDSRTKLMLAAIDRMAERGYKGVSTKEIAAAAGVSEMTLFRQFGSKMNLLEKAIERYHYAAEMTQVFEERLTWNLREDLLLIGRMYHETMDRNRKLFLIVLGDNELAGLREQAQKHPRKLLELLTGYFTEMRSRGKLIETDAEAQAIAFMWLHYGAFLSRLFAPSSITSLPFSEVMESSVELFARGLTP